MDDMKNWKEESGIPHDNGKISGMPLGLKKINPFM